MAATLEEILRSTKFTTPARTFTILAMALVAQYPAAAALKCYAVTQNSSLPYWTATYSRCPSPQSHA